MSVVTGPVERRVAPRMPCHFGALVRANDSRDAMLSYAVEVSETGARVRSLRKLEPGTRVEIALSPSPDPNDTRAVTVRGQIVRNVNPPARGELHDLGIAFDAPLALDHLFR